MVLFCVFYNCGTRVFLSLCDCVCVVLFSMLSYQFRLVSVCFWHAPEGVEFFVLFIHGLIDKSVDRRVKCLR